MSEDSEYELNADLKAWIRKQLDKAVQTLNDRQVFDDLFVESKPAWVLPMQIMLGKARGQSNPKQFRWFVCGDVPLDHIDGAVAGTPREALRYFAMKWQIDADRIGAGTNASLGATLVENAELLYDLTEDERFWSE